MIYNYIPLTYSALADTHTLLQVFADYPQGGNSMLVSNRVVKIRPKYADNQNDSSTECNSPLEGG